MSQLVILAMENCEIFPLKKMNEEEKFVLSVSRYVINDCDINYVEFSNLIRDSPQAILKEV